MFVFFTNKAKTALENKKFSKHEMAFSKQEIDLFLLLSELQPKSLQNIYHFY